jgi:hypothetical protein
VNLSVSRAKFTRPLFHLCKERRLDAIAECGGVNEVDREIVARRSGRQRCPTLGVSRDQCRVVEVGMKTPGPAGTGPADFPGRSIGWQAENFKKVVHACLALRSADAERHEELSPCILVERVEVDGAVTFVAQHLHQSGATFFRGWLQLAVCDP